MTDVAAIGQVRLLECIAAASTAILLAEQNARFASGPTRSGYGIDKEPIWGEGAARVAAAAEAVITRRLAV